MMTLLTGCGIVWDDARGTRHALGIGYVSWPSVPDLEDQAVVAGVDAYGVALFATRAATGLSVGLMRERYVSLGPDQSVFLDCLDCDLATARPRAGGSKLGESK